MGVRSINDGLYSCFGLALGQVIASQADQVAAVKKLVTPKIDGRAPTLATARCVNKRSSPPAPCQIGLMKSLMTELLELARRTDKALDASLREGRSEDIFVKIFRVYKGMSAMSFS